MTVSGQQRYILKRISRYWDWVMRVTDDQYCRPIVAWKAGVLDRLPPVLDHAMVACAVDGEGWALLMRDCSDAMIPPGGEPIAENENRLFIDSMAALHASFWDNPAEADLAGRKHSERSKARARR